jgi:hypothetical protein
MQDGSTRVLRFNQIQGIQSFSAPINGIVTNIIVDAEGWLPDLPSNVRQDKTLQGDYALQFYPNPARDYLTLDVPLGATADVFDMLGRLVLRQTVQQAQLDTHALAPGVYVLRLRGPGDEDLGQAKFVRGQ